MRKSGAGTISKKAVLFRKIDKKRPPRETQKRGKNDKNTPSRPFANLTQKNLKNTGKRAPAPPVNLDSKRTGKHTNKKNKRGGRRRRRRRTARLKKKGCRAMVSKLCWKLMWSSATLPRGGSLLAPFFLKNRSLEAASKFDLIFQDFRQPPSLTTNMTPKGHPKPP